MPGSARIPLVRKPLPWVMQVSATGAPGGDRLDVAARAEGDRVDFVHAPQPECDRVPHPDLQVPWVERHEAEVLPAIADDHPVPEPVRPACQDLVEGERAGSI